MGRRSSGLDDLVLMPWPVALVLGVAGFLLLRFGVGAYFSGLEGEFAQAFGKGVANGALAPLAWMVLTVCWLAALVSYVRARQRKRLLDRTRQLNDLRSIPWGTFEVLVGEMFRRRGYAVEETGLGGADGGVDLVLRAKEGKEIVQCKQWKNAQVGVQVVRELYGVLHHCGATRAWIVCCGDFTPDARSFAAGKPISLVSGDELLRDIRTAQSAGVARAAKPAAVSRGCPRCGAAMQMRTNRQTGERFWGCTAYPRCRATQAA